MRKSLFLSIMDRVVVHDAYVVQRKDAAGVFSLSSIQKCTAALRMLAHGIAADAIDEYCRLGESTAMETMKQFVVTIRACFQSTYLRQPTHNDIEQQMRINVDQGFPGMFGSIDCMHWVWKNCPVAWQS
jgi:hypothetical protein